MAENLGRDEIDWLESLLENVFWGILYEEKHLAKAHKRLAIAKAVFFRVAPDVTEKEAIEYHDSEDDGDDDVDGPENFVRYELGSALASVRHHENGLAEDHVKLARIKALIHRANLAGKIPIDKVAAAVKQRYEKE
jgi:hypothetical protein